jgi:hypothetical protein
MRNKNNESKRHNAQKLKADLEHIKRSYTEWQKTLWQDETIESLSAKAQKAWEQ